MAPDTGTVTHGSGSKNEAPKRNIRKRFGGHDLIKGVILPPDNLFSNTSADGMVAAFLKSEPVESAVAIITR